MKEYKDALKARLEEALGVEITPYATVTRTDFRYPATFLYLADFEKRDGLFYLIFRLEHVVRMHFLDGEALEEALLEFLEKVRSNRALVVAVNEKAYTVFIDADDGTIWRTVDDNGYFVAGLAFNIRMGVEEG